MAFKVNKIGTLIYLTIPAFTDTGIVRHCFTTRQGGASEGLYASLNTSPYKNEPAEITNKNLDIICSAIGIDSKKLVMTKQTHGADVRVVNEGSIQNKPVNGYDALITNLPNIPLITFYADCVPIFLLDPVNKAIGLVHSGWRGTTLHIAERTLEKMKAYYGTKPENCLAAIGPSIERDCFEIGEDTAEIFKQSFEGYDSIVFPKKNGKYLADLWSANMQMLIKAGMKKELITESKMCTKCNSGLFYSYRRDNGQSGSLSAIMELNY
ncbi:peptidoglycan editing factor PgeF [Lutispora sp.]|uniref:peptidoglycan editing factor PgeF n=1 Tax=Lutispora sp. TaxID=2828727 RepID=UPI000ED3206A|nr:peptidoglycan editing factor PgeF [Lutispora sp.]MEA4962006.1 peptidoglycan editing factor PgeF [Lutispora sp.]HCJ57530.1 peptidoglycan editing factor PgeF [Clostridiaceae bacterium]